MTEETKNAPEQDRPEAGTGVAETDTKDVEAAEAEEKKFPDNTVTVEDAGALKKKVTVQVDHQRIAAKFDEMFGELGRTAQVPGFRIGRAPRRLVEKRFGKEVTDDVRNAIIGESMGEAIEQGDFKPIGEPDIKLDEIELPDDGDLTFSFEVDVAPQFDLPEYKGIEVTRPAVEVTDERLEEALTGYLRGYGRLKPVEAPAEEGDVIIADVSITGEGIEHKAPNVELRVAPAQIEGIILEDLPKTLTGKKPGDSLSVKTTVPAAHPNEDWREKEATVTFDIKEVKRLELPELDEEFARRVGFESPADLRKAAHRNLEARMSIEQRRAMREQVCRYLMANTSFELPEDMTKRYANRLLARRYVDMMMRGVPRDQIDQDMEALEAAMSKQAADELKLTFILSKVAEAEDIEVDDGEINARIAQMAGRDNRRPERLRQEMTNEGTLDHLVTAIREEKVIEKLLEAAKINDDASDGSEAQSNESQGTE